MTRLVVVSDLHLNARTSGVRRFDEIAKALWQAAKRADELRADAFIFLGDLTDPEEPDSYRAIGELGRVFRWLDVLGIEPIAIAGNHDLLGEDSLEPTSVLAPLAIARASVFEKPAIFELGREEKIRALALPYTPAWAPYDPEEEAQKFLAALGPGERGLVLGHLNLEGIHPGSEAAAFARGREVFWPTRIFAPHIDRLLLLGGHIHRRQKFAGVQIVGSLAQLDHGEEDHRPGYLEIEI
jgi:DNA repair exonuclease SbcCD nuclease subunit